MCVMALDHVCSMNIEPAIIAKLLLVYLKLL